MKKIKLLFVLMLTMFTLTNSQVYVEGDHFIVRNDIKGLYDTLWLTNSNGSLVYLRTSGDTLFFGDVSGEYYLKQLIPSAIFDSIKVNGIWYSDFAGIDNIGSTNDFIFNKDGLLANSNQIETGSIASWDGKLLTLEDKSGNSYYLTNLDTLTGDGYIYYNNENTSGNTYSALSLDKVGLGVASGFNSDEMQFNIDYRPSVGMSLEYNSANILKVDSNNTLVPRGITLGNSYYNQNGTLRYNSKFQGYSGQWKNFAYDYDSTNFFNKYNLNLTRTTIYFNKSGTTGANLFQSSELLLDSTYALLSNYNAFTLTSAVVRCDYSQSRPYVVMGVTENSYQSDNYILVRKDTTLIFYGTNNYIQIDTTKAVFKGIDIYDNPPHAYSMFMDSSVVISLTQNTWYHITNPYDSLFPVHDSLFHGFQMSGDTLIFEKEGYYKVECQFNVIGVDSKVYQYRLQRENGSVETIWQYQVTGTGSDVLRIIKATLYAYPNTKVWCEFRSTSSAPGNATFIGGQLNANLIHLIE
jgi:hypothetical protein